MVGSTTAVVAELGGTRHRIGLDRGHKLEIRTAGGDPVVIESRPVTEYCAAVDNSGKLHIAAWLLSRHLMYYTSMDGGAFTRSTLLKSDGGLRLKDCLISADSAVTVAYVAETEQANTLVCYRFEGGEWEGRRIVEVELPQKLTAWQFDGSPGGLALLYGVKDAGRTAVMARAVTADASAESVATIAGGVSDFCALTTGGARQACWLAEGHLITNGLRQTEEPWSRTWPFLRRGDSGVQCLWLENDTLCGIQLGAQRTALKPMHMPDPLPCMMALPGELRKAVVDGRSLKEPVMFTEGVEQRQGRPAQQYPSGREFPQGGSGELTLTDVVRNQAIYLTRMQESVGAMERNMLRMQAEVNRLTKEVSSLIKAQETKDAPEPMMRVASFKVPVSQQIIIEEPEPPAELQEEAQPEREAIEPVRAADPAGEPPAVESASAVDIAATDGEDPGYGGA